MRQVVAAAEALAASAQTTMTCTRGSRSARSTASASSTGVSGVIELPCSGRLKVMPRDPAVDLVGQRLVGRAASSYGAAKA